MRKWIILLSVVMVFAVALPAFAAVQNVKVSGDITLRGLYRKNMTLGGSSGNGPWGYIGETDTSSGRRYAQVGAPGAAGVWNDNDGADSTQDWFMSTVRLRVDADLTDNISGHVELLNQRDIDPPYMQQGADYTDPNTPYPGGPASTANQAAWAMAGHNRDVDNQFRVNVSEAYIQAKEFFYDPLTVTVGRQKIQFGDGFVVGANQLTGPDPDDNLTADEFSVFTAFDAIRAQFDWDPLALDLFYAQVKEGIVDRSDDVDLFGANLGYEWDAYEAEAEIYFVGMIDNSIYSHPMMGVDINEARRLQLGREILEGSEDVYAVGTRGSIKPFDRLKLNAELVFEFGEEAYAQDPPLGTFFPNGQSVQDICAFAFDGRAEYVVTECPWPLTIGGEYVMYTGEGNHESGNSGNYRPLFRGKFHSAIREYQGWFYHLDLSTTPGYTNEHQLMADVAFHPFNNEDLTVFGRYLNFWFFSQPVPGRDEWIGQECDVKITYDYTEDLTIGVLGAWFFPGDYFDSSGSPVANIDNIANNQGIDECEHSNISELVGTVTLSF